MGCWESTLYRGRFLPLLLIKDNLPRVFNAIGVPQTFTMTTALHHVALVVTNPERSARIFVALFAAQVQRPGPDHKGPAELAVKMPGLTLVLIQGQTPAVRIDAHVAFKVSAGDLNEMKAKLFTLGIEAQVPRGLSRDNSLYFIDYDNNLFELNSGPML